MDLSTSGEVDEGRLAFTGHEAEIGDVLHRVGGGVGPQVGQVLFRKAHDVARVEVYVWAVRIDGVVARVGHHGLQHLLGFYTDLAGREKRGTFGGHRRDLAASCSV